MRMRDDSSSRRRQRGALLVTVAASQSTRVSGVTARGSAATCPFLSRRPHAPSFLAWRGGASSSEESAASDDSVELGRDGSMFLELFEEEVRRARLELERETLAALEQLREKIEILQQEREARRQAMIEEQEEEEEVSEEEASDQEELVEEHEPAASEMEQPDIVEEEMEEIRETAAVFPETEQPDIEEWMEEIKETSEVVPESVPPDKAAEGTTEAQSARIGLPSSYLDEDFTEEDVVVEEIHDEEEVPETSLYDGDEEEMEGFQSIEKVELVGEVSEDFVVGDSDEEPEAVLGRLHPKEPSSAEADHRVSVEPEESSVPLDESLDETGWIPEEEKMEEQLESYQHQPEREESHAAPLYVEAEAVEVSWDEALVGAASRPVEEAMENELESFKSDQIELEKEEIEKEAHTAGPPESFKRAGAAKSKAKRKKKKRRAKKSSRLRTPGEEIFDVAKPVASTSATTRKKKKKKKSAASAFESLPRDELQTVSMPGGLSTIAVKGVLLLVLYFLLGLVLRLLIKSVTS